MKKYKLTYDHIHIMGNERLEHGDLLVCANSENEAVYRLVEHLIAIVGSVWDVEKIYPPGHILINGLNTHSFTVEIVFSKRKEYKGEYKNIRIRCSEIRIEEQG